MIVGFQKFAEEEKVNINSFTQPIFILPPINNPRIEAQNGAFVMAPLINKVIDKDSALSNRKALDSTEFFDKRRAIIKDNNKDCILHELSILGIDSGTIYKSIEEKLKAIVSTEKWKSSLLEKIL